MYVVCHGSADDFIQAECDQHHTYLSNGDDVYALTQVGSGAILDIIGTTGDDPGSGWEVAGVSNATKDHTLVRDASVTSGNGGSSADNGFSISTNGTTVIGFFLCWVLIKLSQGENLVLRPITAVWFLAVPIMDTLNVIIIRIKLGKSPFKGDFNHIHHIFLKY